MDANARGREEAAVAAPRSGELVAGEERSAFGGVGHQRFPLALDLERVVPRRGHPDREFGEVWHEVHCYESTD